MRLSSSFVLLAVSTCAQTLPANWRVQPAGTQVALDSLPLSAAVSPDGKFLLALNAGARPSVSVVDTGALKETARVPIADAGLGLAFSPDGRRVYAGGGSRNAVLEFTFIANTPRFGASGAVAEFKVSFPPVNVPAA